MLIRYRDADWWKMCHVLAGGREKKYLQQHSINQLKWLYLRALKNSGSDCSKAAVGKKIQKSQFDSYEMRTGFRVLWNQFRLYALKIVISNTEWRKHFNRHCRRIYFSQHSRMCMHGDNFFNTLFIKIASLHIRWFCVRGK